MPLSPFLMKTPPTITRNAASPIQRGGMTDAEGDVDDLVCPAQQVAVLLRKVGRRGRRVL